MTVERESWVVKWARLARAVPRGGVAAGLLVDIVEDPRQDSARIAVFPVRAAAAALRVSPVLLLDALECLSDAGLLRWSWGEAAAPSDPWAVVTLTGA
ncbi:hypothetical protein [Streptomyces sp. H39-S7]|uniref:hypothetical protein n=1 Tax=Streptomyces sp. H39-S7 TaxID=3004357 RepID=UPI0022AF77EF|nr:hypothetical protein [Streptomyces sp. H39-S7]MCZ4125152.1 hypothetical protein [Streptomyces sp. H39-S7]